MSTREGRMFEAALCRPVDYFKRSSDEQWRIDDGLGILDWFGGCSHEANIRQCAECSDRFNAHFNITSNKTY